MLFTAGKPLAPTITITKPGREVTKTRFLQRRHSLSIGEACLIFRVAHGALQGAERQIGALRQKQRARVLRQGNRTATKGPNAGDGAEQGGFA